MLSLSDFILFWTFMELLMLVFMGLSYSLSSNSFRQLMVYFLIQAYSSFSILVFYLLGSSFLLTLSILIKLCMFPFHAWFLPVGYRFNNFILFVSSTFHKLPIFLLLLFFYLDVDSFTLECSVILSIIFSSFTMFVRDFRLLIVCSSVGNNSWFVLSSFCNSFTFFLFFIFYSCSLFLPIFLMKSFQKPATHSRYLSSLFMLALSGLPPFPIFLSKIFIVYQLFNFYPRVFILFILIFNSFMISAYLYYALNSTLFSFGLNSLVLIKNDFSSFLFTKPVTYNYEFIILVFIFLFFVIFLYPFIRLCWLPDRCVRTFIFQDSRL